MKRVMYSKSADARAEFVRDAFNNLTLENLRYLAPKKFIPDLAPRFPGASFYAFEDVVKSNDLFNIADNKTLLVFDRASRYKNITSAVFGRLSRLATKYEYKVLVDIVPFTVGVQFLYCPLAFIDRAILGYQHWYCFRENNLEITENGEQARAHDYTLLAQKLKRHVSIDYADFFSNRIHVIDCPLSIGEKAGYQTLRDRLFAENCTASPIITTLADWTNVTESRYTILKELLSAVTGETIVYTNLASHNRRLSNLFKNVTVKSFYDTNGDEHEFDNVILFELPIVKNYLFLDVISNVKPECQIYIFKSNTTVDKYLHKKMSEEYMGINQFTKILYEVVNA